MHVSEDNGMPGNFGVLYSTKWSGKPHLNQLNTLHVHIYIYNIYQFMYMYIHVVDLQHKCNVYIISHHHVYFLYAILRKLRNMSPTHVQQCTLYMSRHHRGIFAEVQIPVTQCKNNS